jgi:hypothetical protein
MLGQVQVEVQVDIQEKAVKEMVTRGRLVLDQAVAVVVVLVTVRHAMEVVAVVAE